MKQTSRTRAFMSLAMGCLFLDICNHADAQTTTEEWKAAAIKRYPTLNLQGSTLNKRFLALYNERLKSDPDFIKQPDWMMKMADELAPKPPKPDSASMESPEENGAKQLLITQLVEEKYDRFKDCYEFNFKKARKLGPGFEFSANLVTFNKNVKQGLSGLIWRGSFDQHSHEVTILADGKDIHPKSIYTSGGDVMAPIGLEEFKIIASAKKVEARVGEKEFTFSSQDVAAIEAVFLCWMNRVSKQ